MTVEKETTPQGIPIEGFIKVTKPIKNAAVSPHEKVLLIRKGNALFNDGEVETAAKIFYTLNYTDGIVRLGDHYYNKNNYLQALACFKSVGDEGRIEKTANKMASILRSWLNS